MKRVYLEEMIQVHLGAHFVLSLGWVLIFTSSPLVFQLASSTNDQLGDRSIEYPDRMARASLLSSKLIRGGELFVSSSVEDQSEQEVNTEPEYESSQVQIRVSDESKSNRTKTTSSGLDRQADLKRTCAEDGGGCQDNSGRTIETAVFIDPALDSRFNRLGGGLMELNKLVMTIMNQVQQIFRYSSLKMPMTIRLVLIEHLSDSERWLGPLPSPDNGDIDAYLSNFCNWQQKRLEHDNKTSWDHAILLSGLDLYKATPARNHSGVLGLAWVGGMCRGNYSCTINEASSLESAFVIAHEIGHSLGIMHDGQKNNCDPNAFIMSERTGAGKVHWSRCSNIYLNDSISRGQLSCLDSDQNREPVNSLLDLSKLRPPGQVYSVNEQCRIAFGSNYTSFVTRQQPFNAICRELWCVAGTWAKAAHPALDGSACGDSGGKYCREGRCVQRATDEQQQQQQQQQQREPRTGVTDNILAIPLGQPGRRNPALVVT